MIKPMLCKVFEGDITSLSRDRYWFEIKYDGGRVIADNSGKYGIPVLWSRRGNHLNNQFPEIIKDLSLQKKAIFDCELVVFNRSGISDFNLYQRRLCSNPLKIQERMKVIPATLMVFDILQLDGKDLTSLSQQERYNILKKVLQETKNIKLVPHYSSPVELLKMHNIEGIIIKDKNAGYLSDKRMDYWQKKKFNKEMIVKIISYEKHPSGIVMISEEGYRINCNGQLSEIGKQMLDKRKEFKIEVVYLEKTPDGKLRFPSFKRYVDVDVDEV